MVPRAALSLGMAMLLWAGGGLGSVSAQAPPRARSGGPPALWEALDRYARGDYEAGVARAVRVGFDPVQADAWIAAGPRQGQDMRRRVAATCALDVALLRPFLLPRLGAWGRTQFPPGEAGPNEALWLRASIAIAEGFGLWPFLLEDGPAPPPPATMRGRPVVPAPAAPRPIAHLKHARLRLGEDPYVVMAEVVGAEFVTSPAIVGAASRIKIRAPGGDKLGADAADRHALQSTDAVPLLEAAAAAAQRLTLVGPLSGEAHVRLGYLRLRLGDTDAALASFDRVNERTEDTRWRYLARLYSGVTLDRLNRTDEAATAYRAALLVSPGARTATTLLTSLLVRAGRMDDAETLSTQFLALPQVADDPWRHYFLGDYPNARGLLARLRQAIP